MSALDLLKLVSKTSKNSKQKHIEALPTKSGELFSEILSGLGVESKKQTPTKAEKKPVVVPKAVETKPDTPLQLKAVQSVSIARSKDMLESRKVEFEIQKTAQKQDLKALIESANDKGLNITRFIVSSKKADEPHKAIYIYKETSKPLVQEKVANQTKPADQPSLREPDKVRGNLQIKDTKDGLLRHFTPRNDEKQKAVDRAPLQEPDKVRGNLQIKDTKDGLLPATQARGRNDEKPKLADVLQVAKKVEKKPEEPSLREPERVHSKPQEKKITDQIKKSEDGLLRHFTPRNDEKQKVVDQASLREPDKVRGNLQIKDTEEGLLQPKGFRVAEKQKAVDQPPLREPDKVHSKPQEKKIADQVKKSEDGLLRHFTPRNDEKQKAADQASLREPDKVRGNLQIKDTEDGLLQPKGFAMTKKPKVVDQPSLQEPEKVHSKPQEKQVVDQVKKTEDTKDGLLRHFTPRNDEKQKIADQPKEIEKPNAEPIKLVEKQKIIDQPKLADQPKPVVQKSPVAQLLNTIKTKEPQIAQPAVQTVAHQQVAEVVQKQESDRLFVMDKMIEPVDLKSKIVISKSTIDSLVQDKTLDEKQLPQEEKPVEASAISAKQDDLESKIRLPRQTLSYFSQSLKEAVANYKPPVTKMTITLSPARLGSVEVVLKARGKNLEISVKSNQQAVALLYQNSQEFRQNLQQLGFNGVDLSFADKDGRGDQPKNPYSRTTTTDDDEDDGSLIAFEPESAEITLYG